MPSRADQSRPVRRFELIRRLAALALTAALIGLPINDVPAYGLLLVAALIIFHGDVTRKWRPWALSVALVCVALIGQHILKPERIEEGHNVFLTGGANNALISGLPPDVYRLMAGEFDKAFPPEKRCDPALQGCWQAGGFPSRPFAFSADGIFDAPAYSRRVDHIDFDDPVWQRLGFINERIYNWNASVSDIPRLKRDGRFWRGLHRWQVTMPFFVMYRFPTIYSGGDLCWRGQVIWEERNDQFAMLANDAWACRTLGAGDIGKRIFALSTGPDSLAMSLDPPVAVYLRQAAVVGLVVLVMVGIIGTLVRWHSRHLILPAVLVGLSLVVISLNDASFIGGWRPYDAGDNGLINESFARDIVQHLLAGDIRLALRGGEGIFYYGEPGLRYLRALERFAFGDTNLGYLSLILLLPLIVLAIYRRFLPGRFALVLSLIFVAVPVGMFFGTSFVLYSRWAARGFAEPAACVLIFAAVLLLVGRRPVGAGKRFTPAFASALFFALAVCVSPHLAPFAAAMVAGAALWALHRRQWRRIAGLCIGILPVLLVPLHNLYFGGSFSFFSADVAQSRIAIWPADYLGALSEAVRLQWGGEQIGRAVSQIFQLLSGPSGLFVMAPLHAAAIYLLFRVAWRAQQYDPWLRLVAVASFAQLATGLFYVPAPRFFLVPWFFTLLVALVWCRVECSQWVARRYPVPWNAFYKSAFSLSLARGLQRLDAIVRH